MNLLNLSKANQESMIEYMDTKSRVYHLLVIIWQRGGEQRKKIVEIMTSWWLDHIESIKKMEEEINNA